MEPWPSPAQVAALIAIAQQSAPRECCGWVTASTVRPADNIATQPTRFNFAAADLLALARATELPSDHDDYPRAIFHSHPHGPGTLSSDDLATAVVQISDDGSVTPAYTATQLLIVGPHWHIVRFDFDAHASGYFRRCEVPLC